MNSSFPHNLTPPIGSRIVRVQLGGGLASPVVLAPGFVVAADPCVLFSADSLLFAGKRTEEEPWNIWRMPLLGGPSSSEPEQMTHDLGDCREPFYMALGAITPPEFSDKVRWIGFTSTAAGNLDERGLGRATAFYAQSLDTVQARGIVTWRTTFNLNHDFSPTMLGDGRVLFSSWRYGEGVPPGGIVGLVTTNWDGTELNPFFGLHDGEFVKSMAWEIPENRTVVFVESDGKTPLNGGSVARVRMARPLATYERISDHPGRFLTPHALPGGDIIVSYAPDGVNYGIYRYNPETRRLGPCLFDDPDWADIDPQAVLRRPEPQGRITIVLDSKTGGEVQCLNVYDTDCTRMHRVSRGQVKSVRIVEGIPRRSSPTETETLTGWPNVRIIGEALVQDDGSFSLCLPADTPFLCQLLDGDGLALMAMRSWIWIRRGAQYGCMGCHENRELAPENRITAALLRKPDDLTAPSTARRTVDFKHDVAPIIARSCAGCHDANHPTGLNLTGGDAEVVYTRLVAGTSAHGVSLVEPGSARESLLAWRLFGRRLDGTSDTLRRMPLGRELPAEQVRTICTWIDLGAQFDARSPAEALSSGGSR